MDEIEIRIAEDFSETPGARTREEGPDSGERFREEFLEPHFKDPDDNRPIIVFFDGLYGTPTSFLEEAFGGLVRRYGYERCRSRLIFISDKRPSRIDQIVSYMESARDRCSG